MKKILLFAVLAMCAGCTFNKTVVEIHGLEPGMQTFGANPNVNVEILFHNKDDDTTDAQGSIPLTGR